MCMWFCLHSKAARIRQRSLACIHGSLCGLVRVYACTCMYVCVFVCFEGLELISSVYVCIHNNENFICNTSHTRHIFVHAHKCAHTSNYLHP
jgi:hypothetical protein